MADIYNMSDYMEVQIFNHLLRTATWSKPANLYFALTSGVPVSANTGSNLPEIQFANGYARVNYGAPADSGWLPHVGDTAGSNNLPIQWPTCITNDWGFVSGVAVLDAATNGNVLLWGSITTPKVVRVADQPQYTSGNFTVNFD